PPHRVVRRRGWKVATSVPHPGSVQDAGITEIGTRWRATAVGRRTTRWGAGAPLPTPRRRGLLRLLLRGTPARERAEVDADVGQLLAGEDGQLDILLLRL